MKRYFLNLNLKFLNSSLKLNNGEKPCMRKKKNSIYENPPKKIMNNSNRYKTITIFVLKKIIINFFWKVLFNSMSVKKKKKTFIIFTQFIKNLEKCFTISNKKLFFKKYFFNKWYFMPELYKQQLSSKKYLYSFCLAKFKKRKRLQFKKDLVKKKKYRNKNLLIFQSLYLKQIAFYPHINRAAKRMAVSLLRLKKLKKNKLKEYLYKKKTFMYWLLRNRFFYLFFDKKFIFKKKPKMWWNTAFKTIFWTKTLRTNSIKKFYRAKIKFKEMKITRKMFDTARKTKTFKYSKIFYLFYINFNLRLLSLKNLISFRKKYEKKKKILNKQCALLIKRIKKIKNSEDQKKVVKQNLELNGNCPQISAENIKALRDKKKKNQLIKVKKHKFEQIKNLVKKIAYYKKKIKIKSYVFRKRSKKNQSILFYLGFIPHKIYCHYLDMIYKKPQGSFNRFFIMKYLISYSQKLNKRYKDKTFLKRFWNLKKNKKNIKKNFSYFYKYKKKSFIINFINYFKHFKSYKKAMESFFVLLFIKTDICFGHIKGSKKKKIKNLSLFNLYFLKNIFLKNYIFFNKFSFKNIKFFYPKKKKRLQILGTRWKKDQIKIKTKIFRVLLILFLLKYLKITYSNKVLIYDNAMFLKRLKNYNLKFLGFLFLKHDNFYFKSNMINQLSSDYIKFVSLLQKI